MQQAAERSLGLALFKRGGRHPRRQARFRESMRVVRLIVGVGRDKLRRAGEARLSASAHAALMDDQARAGEQSSVRGPSDRKLAKRIIRDRRGLPPQENSPGAERLGGF